MRICARWTAALPALLLLTANAKPRHPIAKVDSFAQIPMTFEENVGQAPADAKFIARGCGYTVLFAATGISVQLKSGTSAASRFQMRWHGGGAAPHALRNDLVLTTSNYFIGSDPARWKTSVLNYNRVRYENVAPGVGLVFYGNQR